MISLLSNTIIQSEGEKIIESNLDNLNIRNVIATLPDVATALNVTKQGPLLAAHAEKLSKVDRKTGKIESIEMEHAIRKLVIVGNQKLVLIGDKRISIMITNSAMTKTALFPLNDVAITSVLHPQSYMNKVVVGSKDGKVRIFNINAAKFVNVSHSLGSEIRLLAQSSVVDVVAVGLMTVTRYPLLIVKWGASKLSKWKTISSS